MSSNTIRSINAELDALYGAVGTESREIFHREAYAYCAGQAIQKTRNGKNQLAKNCSQLKTENELVKNCHQLKTKKFSW